MIDVSLVEEPVNGESFEILDIDKPCLFLGHIVKNEYDNRRFDLNQKYNPKRFYASYLEDRKWGMLPLYGLVMQLNENGLKLVNILKDQEERHNINLIIYENLLNQFDVTCDDCYGYFKNKIYPVDFNKFRHLTDDKITKDKKILQHLLNIDESKFDFQKFGSITCLLLT